MGESFDALRGRWLAGWARFFPEDVTSLGMSGYGSRLREGAGASVGDAERDFHTAMIAALGDVDAAALDGDASIELDAMDRTSRFRRHVLDAGDHDRSCLELSSYPHAMIAHQLAHARDQADVSDALARIASVPAATAARERALSEGLDRGRVPDRTIVDVFVDYVLPGAERAYRGLAEQLEARGLEGGERLRVECTRAASAVAMHRSFVERELRPRAEVGAARLGPDELEARLAWTYGETIRAHDILRAVDDAIGLLSGKLVLAAARSARAYDVTVRSLADALAYVGSRSRVTFEPDRDVRASYAELIDRAARFAVERGLFRVPDESPTFVPIPDGMIHGGAITNWPAPLCDRARHGHVALSLSPASHVPLFAPNLAIHEATPGHFMQSAVWRERFGDSREPVRFVAVHDEVAIAASWFGAMPAIEGFAVHAENVMLEAGFHDHDGELGAVVSALLRAARAACDLALHLRDVSVEEACARLASTTAMPASWCESTIARLLRVPIQATTYFVGEHRHRAMLDDARARLGERFRADVFHDRLLAVGPASLSVLAARSRAAVDDARREAW